MMMCKLSHSLFHFQLPLSSPLLSNILLSIPIFCEEASFVQTGIEIDIQEDDTYDDCELSRSLFHVQLPLC
jgi:hypothetical protein